MEFKKIENRIEYCKKTDYPGIIKCVLKESGEEVYIGKLDDIQELAMKLTDAVKIAPGSIPGTYVLGFEDEEGRVWYGGADPSAYINPLESLEGEVHPKKGEPYLEIVDNPLIRELGKKEELYVWRPHYPIRHIAQVITRKQLGLKI
ncbi:MAG: hypothetical protein DRJ69_02205 [Thermoprotei archaeon]|nr:MAG: hypothetical protein DRJ69_02205 [Thermoprotei archaeon]RLF95661.1 MAG: hypothetical protein DRN52_03655 [Thermococci archaeon]